MIRKLTKTAFVLLFTISTISCSDFLDKEPISDLYAGTFWKTEIDANVGITSMYFSFARTMATGLFDWGEIRGGSWYAYQHNGVRAMELVNHEIPNTNSACNWKNLYQTINRANLAIKYIPEITMASVNRDSYLGEAYAMRALCYFYAIRVWGDVPVFTSPVEVFDENVIYPRRTRREKVLELIQADLAQAEMLLPSAPLALPTSTAKEELAYRTRLSSKPVVYAIMLDLYCWTHQYDLAINLYEDKIATLTNSATGYGLEPNVISGLTQADFNSAYRGIFDKGTSNLSNGLPTSREIIFSVYYAETETGSNSTKTNFNNGSQALVPSDDYLAKKASSDKRFLGCFTGSASRYQLTKYWITPPATTDYSDNFLPIYRYADMVLLYAEALYYSDKIGAAVEQMNNIRIRSGVTAGVVSNYQTDQTKLLDDILHERRMEFMSEGKYWFDLIRNNKIELAGCPDYKVDFPLHRDHLLQNPNLELDPL